MEVRSIIELDMFRIVVCLSIAQPCMRRIETKGEAL